MARLKSRPLQRTTKRKSQDRDRVLREGLRTSSNKRLRMQGPADRPSSSSKTRKKKKGMVFNLFSAVQRPNIGWSICRNCGMIERTVDKQWIKYRALVSKFYKSLSFLGERFGEGRLGVRKVKPFILSKQIILDWT